MMRADQSVEVNLWCAALNNLDQCAKQYYSALDKGSGIHMDTGDDSNIPGPNAAFEHINMKLEECSH